MSEIGNPLVPRKIIEVGPSRVDGWSALRLVVHRTPHSPWLTVGLIETSWAGASALDSRVAGIAAPWSPEDRDPVDLRYYALDQALRALTQTRHL